MRYARRFSPALVIVAFAVAFAQSSPSLLSGDALKKAVPKDYYFRGQTAPVQTRNTAGIRATSDGRLVLAGLVDNSGYASDVQQKYQGFLITEVKLDVGGQALNPGEYGFGFTSEGKFIVMDVGANDLFSIASNTEDNLKRPVPLTITQEDGGYRLYAGKKWVAIKLQ